MLLKFSKSNQPLTVILIPILCFFVWYNPYIQSQNLTTDHVAQMPLFVLLKHLVNSMFASKLTGLILILGIAFYLNHLNTKFIFIAERTYLPSIIYIIVFCSLIFKRELVPSMPAAILFLAAIERLYDAYRSEKLSYNVFDSGLLLGIASLFYFNIVFFILFIWIALTVIRKFYWREWAFSIMGLTLPYYLVFSYYYLTNQDVHIFLFTIRDNFLSHHKLSFSTMQYITGGYLVFLILLGSQYIMKVYPAKKIFTRKSYNLFLAIFFIFLVVFLAVPSSTKDMVTIGAIPVSYLISHYFIRPNRSRFVEILFDVLMIVFIVSQLIKF